MKSKNLLKALPSDLSEEVFETLISSDTIEIERIVSHGHSSPKTGWYQQDRHEWVLVMEGAAKLEFENDKVIKLSVGDYINIPKGCPHKVIWTKPDQATIWLAIHYL